MVNKLFPIPSLLFAAIYAAGMLLAACTPAAKSQAVTATAAALPDGSSIKVGLVTDTGGVNDEAFSRSAWEGMRKAAGDMGFTVKLTESMYPADYGKNIDALSAEGCNVIITVGSRMGDATALKAGQYPAIRFAVIDHSYPDGGPANVTSLMFAEEQAGFLAGVLAGGISKSGFIGSVSSERTPQSERYMKSFFEGAVRTAGHEIRFMNNYINIETTDKNVPSLDDSSRGKDTALRLIGQGCDVVFAIGGDTLTGVLQAAMENNLPAVGADVDRYNTNPEVRSALITSAMKNVDVVVYNYLKSVADGSVRAGVYTGTLKNGGVGLAPFHDWDDRISGLLKARIEKAGKGIRDGSIKIDLN